MSGRASTSAGRQVRPALTSKGRAAVALDRIRGGWDSLGVFEQVALAAKLSDLVEAYAPRRAERRPTSSAE